LLAQQINRAPRTALGRDQHDIAHKRLKVDFFLAAKASFAGEAVTLQSQKWIQVKPCPARTAPMHPKRKITGYRPTAAIETFRIIESRANQPRSACCVGTDQKCRQQKAPNIYLTLLPTSRIELKTWTVLLLRQLGN
jgi:hypothetical protein